MSITRHAARLAAAITFSVTSLAFPQLSEADSLSREAEIAQDGVSEVDVTTVSVGPRIFVATATRLANGRLQVATWDADNLELLDSFTAGSASQVTLASAADGELLVGYRRSDGKQGMTAFDVATNGDLTRRSTRTSNNVSSVTVRYTAIDRYVATVKNSAGRLVVQSWEIDGGVPNLTASEVRGRAGDADVSEAGFSQFDAVAYTTQLDKLRVQTFDGSMLTSGSGIGGDGREVDISTMWDDVLTVSQAGGGKAFYCNGIKPIYGSGRITATLWEADGWLYAPDLESVDELTPSGWTGVADEVDVTASPNQSRFVAAYSGWTKGTCPWTKPKRTLRLAVIEVGDAELSVNRYARVDGAFEDINIAPVPGLFGGAERMVVAAIHGDDLNLMLWDLRL